MKQDYIQIEGKFYQKSKVVMLPTTLEKLGEYIPHWQLMKGNSSSLFNWVVGENTTYCTPQHLYFLSNEEIKEGDWVLLPNKILKRMSNDDMIHYIDSMSNATKKIIATTDKSLLVYISKNKKL